MKVVTEILQDLEILKRLLKHNANLKIRINYYLTIIQFLEFHLQSRFFVNEHIAKNYTKTIFFWSLCCSCASITADFENSIFNLTHNVPPSTSFQITKSLKRMLCMAYTAMDQAKYRVSTMFAFGCIIWTLLNVFTCTQSGPGMTTPP